MQSVDGLPKFVSRFLPTPAALRQSTRLAIHLAIVSVLAGTISAFIYKPSKTNRAYLLELVGNQTMEKTAAALVSQLRAVPGTNYTPTEWRRIEAGLSACLDREARLYAASADPYLGARANADSPTILARRFLKTCGY
jgi:hypothetical protein